jgi:dTMP kinase
MFVIDSMKSWICTLLFLPTLIFSQGKLIEFCGIDGCGKSTLIQDLKDELKKQGKPCVVIKPISGDKNFMTIISRMETSLQNSPSKEVYERFEKLKNEYYFLEFYANSNTIKTYLKQDMYVLCDRYTFSYLTYQEAFNMLSPQDKDSVEKFPKPDLIVLMTLPIDLAMQRLDERAHKAPYENPKFLTKAQNIFLREKTSYPNLLQIEGGDERSKNLKLVLDKLK